MPTNFEYKHLKVRALHDWVIISDMEFGEMTTKSGLVIRSDNGKSHGIKPRWGKVYCVGPKQTDVKVGDWVLVEHGRWTRGMHINDGERNVTIQRVDVTGIIGWSDEIPTADELHVGDSM